MDPNEIPPIVPPPIIPVPNNRKGNVANLSYFKPGNKFGVKGGAVRRAKSVLGIASRMMEARSIDQTITFANGNKSRFKITTTCTILQAIMGALIREALKGNVAAAKEVLERAYGKVPDKINVERGQPLCIVLHPSVQPPAELSSVPAIEVESEQSPDSHV